MAISFVVLVGFVILVSVILVVNCILLIFQSSNLYVEIVGCVVVCTHKVASAAVEDNSANKQVEALYLLFLQVDHV